MEEKLYLKAEIEEKDGSLIAVASTSVEDRHGETVSVEGWDLKNFKKNPVLLWGHDHTQPAVGVAKKTWVEGVGKKAKLMIEPVFQEVTELGRAVKQLVADGFIRSLSVGFRPIDQDGTAYTKQELLEVSFVNVPANPEAMMLAYKSLKEAKVEEEVISKLVDVDMADYLAKQEQRINRLEGKVDTAVKGLEHLNPHLGRDQRIVKERLSLNKVIAKASDQLLAEKQQLPTRAVTLIKAIKISNEIIIGSQKGELNGSNQRIKGQSRKGRA